VAQGSGHISNSSADDSCWRNPLEPLLNISDVARLLGRSPQTLKRDLNRNPSAVPPRVELPGTRLLRWREVDVEQWIARHAMSEPVSGSALCLCRCNEGRSGNGTATLSREVI
jgi:predicted DNA-binding transcriptional regulator AlpA